MSEKYVFAQGFYAGIPCLMGQFTLSPGSRPSAATLYFMRNQMIPPSGDLVITGVDEFGSPSSISFPSCFVDNVQAVASGDPLLVARVLDRRRSWEFGAISGHYNIRSESGDSVFNEKTPRQLAELCLSVMGENNADLGDFNPTTRPAVDWVLTNPARALEALLDQFGYRIILGIDNRVHIERAGVGDITWLQQFTWLEDTIGTDVPNRPDGLIAVAGRTLYDMELWLEPVGLELSGEWKNIDKLSYRPPSKFVGNYDVGGWSSTPLPYTPANLVYPSGATEEEKDQINKLAVRHVYRTYRICVRIPPHWMEDNIPNGPPYGDYLKIAGYRGKQVKERWQLLPLEQNQNLKLTNKKPGEKPENLLMPKRVAPEVYGCFNSGQSVVKDATTRNDMKSSSAGEPPNSRVYSLPYEIDFERGLVYFDALAYCIIDKVKKPARLKLRIASGVRDELTREWTRYTIEHRFSPALGAGMQILPHEEVQLRFHHDKKKNLLLDNKTEVDQELKLYLNAAVVNLQQRSARSGVFAGIVPISPTGLVQQVTWNFGAGPTTQFSANTDHNFNVPSYQDRRLLALLGENARSTAARAVVKGAAGGLPA